MATNFFLIESVPVAVGINEAGSRCLGFFRVQIICVHVPSS